MDEIRISAEPVELPINRCNWPDAYPYSPDAKATLRLSPDGKNLIIRYEVKEDGTAALTGEDNGPVWTDSCCEFFIKPQGSEGYYNIEANAAGHILIGYREPSGFKSHAPAEVLAAVERKPSLGRGTFAEKPCGPWSLELRIPATSLFRHDWEKWDGMKASFNLYKCGDNLSKPHFLSHAPITGVRAPNFHLPQFFRPVSFVL